MSGFSQKSLLLNSICDPPSLSFQNQVGQLHVKSDGFGHHASLHERCHPLKPSPACRLVGLLQRLAMIEFMNSPFCASKYTRQPINVTCCRFRIQKSLKHIMMFPNPFGYCIMYKHHFPTFSKSFPREFDGSRSRSKLLIHWAMSRMLMLKSKADGFFWNDFGLGRLPSPLRTQKDANILLRLRIWELLSSANFVILTWSMNKASRLK
jgi:hypothetical protein